MMNGFSPEPPRPPKQGCFWGIIMSLEPDLDPGSSVEKHLVPRSLVPWRVLVYIQSQADTLRNTCQNTYNKTWYCYNIFSRPHSQSSTHTHTHNSRVLLTQLYCWCCQGWDWLLDPLCFFLFWEIFKGHRVCGRERERYVRSPSTSGETQETHTQSVPGPARTHH